MPSTTIRISEALHKVLREIASRKGVSMQAIVEAAIEEYRRKQFFEDVSSAYSALRSNQDDWADELAERREWEGTLGDDLGNR